MIGGLFGKRPPHGAVLSVSNGTARGDGNDLALSGQLTSPFLGQRSFVGRLQGDRWHAELRRGGETGAVGGTMDAVPATSIPPVRDYASLATDIQRTITSTIYDPHLPGQAAYRRFFTELASDVGRARDDLDVIVAFEAAKARLGTSHLRITRNPQMAKTSLDAILAGNANVNPENLARLSFQAPGVAYLRVTSWDRVTGPVDRAFERMVAMRASVLILDIRGNPGGDATSFSPAAHLIARPTPVGVLLSRPWYAVHRTPPTPDELARLPIVRPEMTPLDWLRELDAGGALVGRVEPHPTQFTGEVFVVTDRRTGSASEPLAHLLKATRRATLVGERTGGAMLLALPYPLTDGFVVTVPKADYYAGDGTRLEGRGVEPDLKATSQEALVVVAKRIRQTRPYAGNLLLGGVYLGLGRLEDAERAYRTALTLATTDADRAIVQRQLNAVATARQGPKG
jgi:hypothetical protein